jgi:hypothetical protein
LAYRSIASETVQFFDFSIARPNYQGEDKCLANPDTTGYKKATVFFPFSTQGRSGVQRWIGVVLFLFFFVLPLHFHPVIDSQQISQECSCYCGGLSQLGVAPAPVVVSVADEVFFAPRKTTEIPVEIIFESECARAPPPSSL